MNDDARTNTADTTPPDPAAGGDHRVLLVLDDGYPWTVDEIGRELDAPGLAEDGVKRLVGAGLLHQHGAFVWPTRAARLAVELHAGTV
ncbi:MAG: hypothetical protein ACYCPS_04860 [Candidatus Saccharimonadales bacterium]